MTNRWRTSIHEAGHGVVAVVLGGRCDRLVIWQTGGGSAFPAGLTATDQAFMTAAGPAAETILADEPAPDLEIFPTDVLPDDAPNYELPTAAKLEIIAAKFPPGDSPTDEQHIAQFCVSGLEAEPPERWARRYHFVHAMAERIVTDHREAIVRVATALFQRGVLEETEIKELLECPC